MVEIKLEDGEPMQKRSESEISKAISEMHDRVWYERKLVMLDNMRRGIEETPENLMDEVTKAMREVEAKYSDLGVKGDFEWGMINGKLSALRWVLGEEWDFLDT